MRSAKILFQSSPAFKEYGTLLNSPAFELACSAALASFSENLPQTAAEPSRAWDAYLQILGARRVLEVLSTLHEPDQEPKTAKWPTIDYEASKTKTRQ